MPPKQAATPSSRVPKGFHSETPLSRIHGLIAQLTDDLKDLSEDAPARSTLSELTSLVTGFEPYMASVSSKPPQVVRDSIEESNNVDWAAVHKAGHTQYKLIKEMSAGSYEAVVLQQLARMSGAKRILEIGCFYGSTALALALVPTVERVTTLELEPYLIQQATPWWEKAGVRGKVDARVGDALQNLAMLAREAARFDFIFIDANKDGYRAYYDAIMKTGLATKTATVLIDNSLYKGTPWTPDSHYEGLAAHIRDFNTYVKKDKRVEVVHLPVRDGIALIRWKDSA